MKTASAVYAGLYWSSMGGGIPAGSGLYGQDCLYTGKEDGM
ncbi:hypothetical protein CBFG_05420 [Clostridiales bacterium 1_7_47FAA]|nr:hypothetical protein CBFG_05420 [Clostridiales bacterium 1_7_47FAA]